MSEASTVPTAAHQRPLGRAGLSVGPIGYGAASLGNLYAERPDQVWPLIAPAAWDAGVRYFDTAPHYGLGLSEQRLGLTLQQHPRDQYILSTKVGRLLEPNPDHRPGDIDMDHQFAVPTTLRRRLDYSRDGVLRSVESSLQRLGVDRIDILFVHDPDEHEREALEGAFPALEELRSQGVIRSYGAGMNQSAMLARFVRETDLDVVMCAGRYSLLDQSAATDLLPIAAERSVSVVMAGVFNSGILAHDQPPASATYDYSQAPSELIERARAIAGVAGNHGCTLPQLAVQFALRPQAVATVVLGASTPEQVVRNATLAWPPAPEQVWDELEAAGLIGG